MCVCGGGGALQCKIEFLERSVEFPELEEKLLASHLFPLSGLFKTTTVIILYLCLIICQRSKWHK